jgi:hypothetical protein
VKEISRTLAEGSWFLHYNVPMHMVLFIQKKNITPVLSQTTYSCDLSPAELLLLPKLKVSSKGSRFQSTQEEGEKC